LIELVSVGDWPIDPATSAVVAAAREAMVNAAKHSGVTRIDVYAEASERELEVFVRDRGRGFDLDAVPGDRLGVRRSILDRVQRHGGTAELSSDSETGTEVRLVMPVNALATSTHRQEAEK
jgi:signal transduction histidine kinase